MRPAGAVAQVIGNVCVRGRASGLVRLQGNPSGNMAAPLNIGASRDRITATLFSVSCEQRIKTKTQNANPIEGVLSGSRTPRKDEGVGFAMNSSCRIPKLRKSRQCAARWKSALGTLLTYETLCPNGCSQ
jgi:hypothetical protein